ncbi:binary cytotoxin component [Pseudomonas sp. StFLB209]|uniref:alpha-xenorhabdolysin family binary toxin subunit A n=1 Tax=Pseudomonas sp. StFLB209 TaxID=1028989 RepID=UPI0004F88E6D|nr:alpha-xenorhabdolysin family binary toxin subunit A [Pseudomonas sp. StFLB209]BAP43256.1 binary cytotoxin component [Pseudomonas sp. StFLB209]
MSNEHVALATDAAQPDVSEISRVSNDFIRAASGVAQNAARDRGLLITNEDVRSIHRYVSSALALPSDIAQVRQLLGNYQSGIPGLQPEDVKQLYLTIQEHAASWAGLEDDMRAVGSDLHVFAGNLVRTAEDMVGFIQGLEAWRTLKLSELSVSEIEQMPMVELTDSDRRHLPGLLALVGDLKLHIADYSSSTRRVSQGLEAFKAHLRDRIRPEVARKIDLASSAEAGDNLVQLKDRIVLLNERINQKASEYEEYCGYRWVGFWWGPAGGAVSWSIYGPKAAEVLAQQSQLIDEKQTLETQLRQHDRFLGNLFAFESGMQDLRTRIEGAASSISNIESIWSLLEKLADDSHRRINDLDNALLLVVFVSRFRAVIANWQDIKEQAFNMLTAFNRVVGDVRR